MKRLAIIAFLLFSLVLSFEDKRLIEFVHNGKQVWMTIDQIKAMAAIPGVPTHFIDVTEGPRTPLPLIQTVQFPAQPQQQAIVKPLLPKVESESEGQLRATITKLSNFTTRYATSATGKQAAEWLYSQYQRIISELPADRRSLFSVEYYKHDRFQQPSIIATMKGSSDEIVILGGHEDSTASGYAPGADDDASGSSSVLEVFRIIANSNLVPKRTIQFHAYAAEEMGLLGSRDISNKYKQTNVKVYGMMQLDMTAYNPRQSKIAIVTTSTSSLLNTFVRKLVAEYCKVPSVDRTLFGGTSDHASWTRNGYHAVFPFEVDMNPHIHTSRDTIDKLDLKFATEYVKLGIAFVVEMSLA